MKTFAGELETHWTFHEDKRRPPERITEIAKRFGLKVTHIVLDVGANVSQPMFSRRRRGTLPFELADAQALAMQLGNEGLVIRRVKIEAALGNEDVPHTDADAMADLSRYFEHHIRLIHPAGIDLAELAPINKVHHANLSRNVATLKEADVGDVGESNIVERFMTQRCYGVGAKGAEQQLNALLDAIRSLPEHEAFPGNLVGYQIGRVDREYVIYDSNLAFDAGWIDKGDRPVNKLLTYPNTFQALTGDKAKRPEIFDPALKHFSHAFRRGEPELSAAETERWRTTQQSVLEPEWTSFSEVHGGRRART